MVEIFKILKGAEDKNSKLWLKKFEISVNVKTVI